MLDERRFGRRLALPSTVQIVRELKALIRADQAPAEHTGLASADDHSVAASGPRPIGAGLVVPPTESL